ncbi:Protein of unknown function [Ruaniaceae bacterium KH17]|nr:Protein of unknown function [Ruaniaceae bacterium KH17]
MRELTFTALNGDVLEMSDAEDEQYSIVLTPELRTAIRESAVRRPEADEVREYRPKDIQQLLRAGMSVDEICERSGLPIAHIERYEGPVVAERDWTIESAQGFAVGHSSDSPTLGELVINRLATRGVTEVEWDAVRDGTDPWRVIAQYSVSGSPVEATWEVDLSTRSVRALDDESRWLSETDTSSPRARRHLAASVLYNSEDEGVFSPAAEDDPDDSTDSLLRHLHSHRGVRQSEDEILANILDSDDEIPAAHPRPAEAQNAHEAIILPLPFMPESAESAPEPASSPSSSTADAPTTRRPRSRGRRSVPSWDEIVFGSES